MFLIKGDIIDNKMIPMYIYNMDSDYNRGVVIQDGILMESEPEYKPCDIRGKEYKCFLNIDSKEYEYVLSDRELTLEEQNQIKDERINALEDAILALMDMGTGGISNV